MTSKINVKEKTKVSQLEINDCILSGGKVQETTKTVHTNIFDKTMYFYISFTLFTGFPQKQTTGQIP